MPVSQMNSSQNLSGASHANTGLENIANDPINQDNGSHCPLNAGNAERKLILPRPFVSVGDQNTFRITAPYGSANGITLTEEDMERHIPLWNCKLKYKLVGFAAPLGKNLLAYLKKKKGEFEVYTDQDSKKMEGEESARVTLWNKEEKRKMYGCSAPLRKNLEKYLKKHPCCEVYNGQDKNLDPSIRDPSHNRVVLWNKITCRRTGFGCSGPLRKNLQRYLSRHPHLEEYIGQDRLLEKADPGEDEIMRDQVSGAVSEIGELRTVDNQGSRQQHPRTPCGKRPYQYLNEGGPSKENIRSLDHTLAQSIKRLCSVHPSEVPDFEAITDVQRRGPVHPTEWYESCHEITERLKRSSLHNDPAGKEDDNMNCPRTMEEGHDGLVPNAEEYVTPRAERDDIHPQVDEFLDLSREPVPTFLTCLSPGDDANFNPDDFFNSDS